MNHERNFRPAGGLDTMLAEASAAAADLARSEMALLRRELTTGARRFSGGLAAAATALFCAFLAIGLASLALVEWLTPVVGSRMMAMLVTAALALALALACALFARLRLSAETLDPELTRRSLADAGERLRESLRR